MEFSHHYLLSILALASTLLLLTACEESGNGSDGPVAKVYTCSGSADSWSEITPDSFVVSAINSLSKVGTSVVFFGGATGPDASFRYAPIGGSLNLTSCTWKMMPSLSGFSRAPFITGSVDGSWLGWGDYSPYSTARNQGGLFDLNSGAATSIPTTGGPSSTSYSNPLLLGRSLVAFSDDGSQMFGWSPNQSQWIPLASPVVATSTMETYGNYIFSFAADSGTGHISGRFYDLASDTWKTLNTGAAPPTRGKTLWTGTKILVIGGIPRSGVGCSDAGSFYDPISNTWTSFSTAGVFSGCDISSVGISNSKIFAVGKGASFGLYVYDDNSNSWSSVALPGGLISNYANWYFADHHIFTWRSDVPGLFIYNVLLGQWSQAAPPATFGAIGARPGDALNPVWTGSSMMFSILKDPNEAPVNNMYTRALRVFLYFPPN